MNDETHHTMSAPLPEDTTCDYCGFLDWTVERYGRVTHKDRCPHRTDPWHQGDPQTAEWVSALLTENEQLREEHKTLRDTLLLIAEKESAGSLAKAAAQFAVEETDAALAAVPEERG